MGDMLFEDMRDALHFDLELLDNLVPDQMNRWLNWTYRHVCQPRVFRHTELQTEQVFTLVLDQIAYPLSTVYYMDHVVFVAGAPATDLSLRRKRLRGPKDLREFEDATWARSEPTEYARWGTNLYLDHRPGPTQVGQLTVVRGYTRPALLADGQTTVLRPEFDEILIVGARWRGFRSLGRYDAAEAAKADFVDLIRDQQEQRHTEAEDWGGYFELDTQEYEG